MIHDKIVLSLADFTDFPFQNAPFHAPGVYVFLNSEDKPIYAGQSEHVSDRFSAHRRKPWGKEIVKTLWLPLADQSERLVAEALMIFKYRPRYNRTVKMALRLDGTFFEIQFVRGQGAKP